MSCLLEEIVVKARSIGLNVDPVALTPVNIDSFFYAVIETLSLTDRPCHKSVYELRYEVVSYIDRNRNSEMVQNYLATLNDTEINLDAIIQAQYCGRDADELIIKATAELLGIQIWITNKHSSPSYPFVKILPVNVIIYFSDPLIDGIEPLSEIKIILGHSNRWFQSLKWREENNPSSLYLEPDYEYLDNDLSNTSIDFEITSTGNNA